MCKHQVYTISSQCLYFLLLYNGPKTGKGADVILKQLFDISNCRTAEQIFFECSVETGQDRHVLKKIEFQNLTFLT